MTWYSLVKWAASEPMIRTLGTWPETSRPALTWSDQPQRAADGERDHHSIDHRSEDTCAVLLEYGVHGLEDRLLQSNGSACSGNVSAMLNGAELPTEQCAMHPNQLDQWSFGTMNGRGSVAPPDTFAPPIPDHLHAPLFACPFDHPWPDGSINQGSTGLQCERLRR